MTIAVTGATGYLGAQMLLRLMDAGHPFLAIDRAGTLPEALRGQGMSTLDVKLEETDLLVSLFQQHQVTDVIHISDAGSVPQSINDPLTYYRNNTVGALAIIAACARAGVTNFVLSSTASVYGVPQRIPIAEEENLDPIAPFGASMAMAERIVNDVATSKGLNVVTLRYFNAAGADPEGRAGERGKPQHLIKVAAQIAVGTRKEKLKINGRDYQTPDGTTIRDYAHVADIADAHLSSIEYLKDGGASRTLNVGYGQGASILEVVKAVERVTGKPLPREDAPRRVGDPPLLIADNAAIRSTLDWTPQYDDLDFIVRSAIEWEKLQAENNQS
ncbi:MAG: UDP-glucose 4-epimerase GalE [Parvularculaceae bacterium]